MLRRLWVVAVVVAARKATRKRIDDALEGTFPWMATILKGAPRAKESMWPYLWCGGSLIDAEWILTAAHCIGHDIPCTASLSVLVGGTNLESWFDEPIGPELIDVESSFLHPDYDALTFANDVALLKLSRPSRMPPLTLATNRTSGQRGLVAGWGDTTDLERLDEYPPNLQYTWLPIVEDTVCDAALRSFDRNTTEDSFYYYGSAFQGGGKSAENLDFDTMFCAGWFDDDDDDDDDQGTTMDHQPADCFGDSGGPIVVPRDDAPDDGNLPGYDDWIQVGLASWGLGCADTYGVYADVTGDLAAFINDRDTLLQATAPPTFLRDDVTIRLVDGMTPYEGRLEVLYDGVWGTVCDNSFRDPDADVVCNQLFGTTAIQVLPRASSFGPGTDDAPVWMDQVTCKGDESNLGTCCFAGWGADSVCSHTNDVSVACEIPMVVPPPTNGFSSSSSSSKSKKSSSNNSSLRIVPAIIILVCVVLLVITGILSCVRSYSSRQPEPQRADRRDDGGKKETELVRPTSTMMSF